MSSLEIAGGTHPEGEEEKTRRAYQVAIETSREGDEGLQVETKWEESESDIKRVQESLPPR